MIKGQWKLRKAKDVARDVAETLSAFANSDGGTLLLGVDDDGSISGVDFPEEYKTLEAILLKKGYIKNEDIRWALKVPRHTALRIAQKLVDLGILKRIGKGKGMKYMRYAR